MSRYFLTNCVAVAAVTLGAYSTPAFARPSFDYKKLPYENRCLDILPVEDVQLKELKLKCKQLMFRPETQSCLGGGGILALAGRPACWVKEGKVPTASRTVKYSDRDWRALSRCAANRSGVTLKRGALECVETPGELAKLLGVKK
jgi:hypothetical protein